jgi:hypothetical protein
VAGTALRYSLPELYSLPANSAERERETEMLYIRHRRKHEDDAKASFTDVKYLPTAVAKKADFVAVQATWLNSKAKPASASVFESQDDDRSVRQGTTGIALFPDTVARCAGPVT